MTYGRTTAAAMLILALATTASAQIPIPKRRLDYSRCRFDSTTIALFERHLPKSIYASLVSYNLDPRLLHLYLTAIDANFEDPKGPATHKILYGVDGQHLGALIILEKDSTGTYKTVWLSQDVPPAGKLRLRLRDLNGDGRLDIVATSRGGDPVLQALAAFEFKNGHGRIMTRRGRGPYDTQGAFGIAEAVIDSLGRQGRPAIEVWQDDSSSHRTRFIHILQQYSDSTGFFETETVDTVRQLPSWGKGRRR